MPRLLLAVLVIIALGATGFGAAQLMEVRKVRSNAEALERERAELRRKIWELQQRNAELDGRLARAPEAAARPAAPAENAAESSDEVVITGPNGETARFRRGAAGDFRRGMEAAMNSPEVQRLMAIQQKSALDGRYAALFRNLNLSPAQLERFKELLVERQAAAGDVLAAAQAQGLMNRGNRNELRELMQQSQAEVDAMIRAELGEATYAQYKSYEATLPYRGTVEQLEQRLSYSGAPLSAAQAEQVAQILAETSVARGGGRMGGAVNFTVAAGPAPAGLVRLGVGGPSISDDVLARAQGVLQPKQMEALKAIQEEQRAMQELQRQMRANAETLRRANQDGQQPARAPGG